jgi:peptide/nickel transport system permease protein
VTVVEPVTEPEALVAAAPPGPWWWTYRRRQFARLTRNPAAMFGLVIVAIVLVTALIAPWVAPDSPIKISSNALKPPSWDHLMGTDDLGRDEFSRVLYGARISPIIGLLPVLASLTVGTLFGLVSGYSPAGADTVMMRVVDVMLAFPGLILAIAVVSLLGPGLENAMIAVGVSFIPVFARVTRGSVLVEKEKDYVRAAKAAGAGSIRIMFREILPNVMGPIIVLGTLTVATALLAAAGLSFIGLGAQEPTPEWGAMLATGREYIATQWWLAAFPGLAIAITVLGINLLGDGLREIFDPRV